MTNNGMKPGTNGLADAENYLKYLDGTAYRHIPGLVYLFDDSNGPNHFRIVEKNNGDLSLEDYPPDGPFGPGPFETLCQYACQGEIHKNMIATTLKLSFPSLRHSNIYYELYSVH